MAEGKKRPRLFEGRGHGRFCRRGGGAFAFCGGWKAESVQGILERRLDLGQASRRSASSMSFVARAGGGGVEGLPKKIKPKSQSDCDLGLIFLGGREWAGSASATFARVRSLQGCARDPH